MVVWHHKKSKTSRGVVNTAYRNEKLSLISRDKRLTPRKQSGRVLSRPSLTNRTQADTRLDRAELSIFTSVAYYSTSAILRRKKWDVLKNRRHRANALSRVLTLLSPTNRTQGDTRRDRCEKTIWLLLAVKRTDTARGLLLCKNRGRYLSEEMLYEKSVNILYWNYFW